MKPDLTKKANQEDWHPEDIKAALHKSGVTLMGLARQHGLTCSSSFSAALVRSLPANEKRIADALGIHPMVIWPSRYNTDGSIKPRGFRAVQSSPASHPRNGKAVAGDKSGVTA